MNQYLCLLINDERRVVAHIQIDADDQSAAEAAANANMAGMAGASGWELWKTGNLLSRFGTTHNLRRKGVQD